ncbi:NgoFVII family restriction endonuclease [Lactobacillus kefiranofaciens]|uniref:restriction endonuclease PLD domain-containing protein n=1 Tax=Lactobacillus kefiranofaciens TaxID=267818 RepID=UPI0024683561|nr:restriction endonuclease PLD domain-containing protein [Lactobacillus kefiranofaciens]MDH5101233.1 NgoFVII family restriction endonuclease [Lactobacillus kefiranofaciens]
MTVWERYSKEEQKDYEDYLKMYGALSALFNQKSSETGAPYLDSKFQETIYARCFKSEDVDIGNTPHDIRSTFGSAKIGIGLKTWLSSKPSYQKVMQLKRFRTQIEPHQKDPDDLAYIVSKIKNQRLITDYKRLGLDENDNIYHYVTRDSGKMLLSETSYPLVDMDRLKPGKLSSKSFTFSDGIKDYKYTFGDSQIWMRFDPKDKNTVLLDTLNIDILDDPFTFLKSAFKKQKGVYAPLKPKYDYLYLPLYSYKTKTVAESSGLNAWNGLPKTKGSTTLRPKGEAYIPIPKKVWKKHPYWVDPNVNMADYKAYKKTTGKSGYKIRLHMPDGQIFPALFTQSDFKSLQTKPQSILGLWILNVLGVTDPQRKQYDQPATNIVTMNMLQKAGFDSVKLWHQDPNNLHDIWIDFAEYGSFERFMKDEPQIQDDDNYIDE